jgi:hypothetical protein
MRRRGVTFFRTTLVFRPRRWQRAQRHGRRRRRAAQRLLGLRHGGVRIRFARRDGMSTDRMRNLAMPLCRPSGGWLSRRLNMMSTST